MKKFLIPTLLLLLTGWAVSQVTISNSGGISLGGGLSVTRVLTPNTTVTLDGTNAVLDLSAATNFRVNTGAGNVYLIFSNLVDGASGRVTVYADGSERNVSANADYRTADGEQLSLSVTNWASFGFYADGTASTNIWVGGTWFE